MNYLTWFGRVGVASVFIATVWDIELWRGAILAWVLAVAAWDGYITGAYKRSDK